MQTLETILQQVKQLIGLVKADNAQTSESTGTQFLFEAGEEDVPNADRFGDDDSAVSDERVAAYLRQQEILELKRGLLNNMKNLFAEGGISEEQYGMLQSLMKSSIETGNTESFENYVETINTEETGYTEITDVSGISDAFSEMGTKTREGILEQIGDISNVSSVVIYENGTVEIKTDDNNTFTAFPSGEYVASYDNSKRSGFDLYNADNQLTSSTYIDHTRNDNVVQEVYEQHEDGGYTQTINDSAEPDITKTVEVSADNDIVSISTTNNRTGETTTNFTQGENNDQGGIAATGGLEALNGDLEQSNQELADLQQQQEEAQDQLETDQESYDATEDEMEADLDSIDADIDCGEDDLEGAESDLSDAESVVADLQEELDSAISDLEQADEAKNEAQEDLNEAESVVAEEQDNTSQACEANQQAIQEEQAASQENCQKGEELAAAQDATSDAAAEKAVTGAGLGAGIEATQAAFDVRNQMQAKVDAAQGEYNNAQAAGKKDASLWEKFKNWVANAFNKLQEALGLRDKAQADLEAKQREEERLRIIDEAAAQKLQEREAEQREAQSVKDAAQVVLDRKTGEREVTDQEYADALLDLADAMVQRDDASSEYDSALEQFMETNNYKVDVDGQLTDANGNKLELAQVVTELEAFVQGLVEHRTATEASYEGTLSATAQAISGDEEAIQNLGDQIAALEEHIAEQQAQIALQEQMLAALQADKGELNAATDTAGYYDDRFALEYGIGWAEDMKEYQANRAALEAAILSGNEEDMMAAYKAIYGTTEVYFDSAGNIVDPATITSANEGNYTKVRVSEMDAEMIRTCMQTDITAASIAQKQINKLDSGNVSYQGQVVTRADVTAMVQAQADEIVAQMDAILAAESGGTQFLNTLNDFFGIGTSVSEMRSQVQHYKDLVDQLAVCTDPVQYAALYKEITGTDFNQSSISSLIAYTQLKHPETPVATGGAAAEETTAVDEEVGTLTDLANTNVDVGADALSVTSGSRAQQEVNTYAQQEGVDPNNIPEPAAQDPEPEPGPAPNNNNPNDINHIDDDTVIYRVDP